jgi:hypothetical protein
MNEGLRKALCDYFDAGEFADLLGITVDDLITDYPDQLDDALDDLKEIIGWPVDNDEE